MNAEYFEKQRPDMLAAVRAAISDHMAAQAGKTALDERFLRAMIALDASRRVRIVGAVYVRFSPNDASAPTK